MSERGSSVPPELRIRLGLLRDDRGFTYDELRQIAGEEGVNVSLSTIFAALKGLSEPRSRGRRRASIPNLQELYEDRNMTAEEISDLTGYSLVTVKREIKRQNIKTRSPGRRKIKVEKRKK